MGRQKKEQQATMTNEIKTRDPVATTRDPVPKNYVPIDAPTVCPKCGANSRLAIGITTFFPTNNTMMEPRACIRCGMYFGKVRPMSTVEQEKTRSMRDAIVEYTQKINR